MYIVDLYGGSSKSEGADRLLSSDNLLPMLFPDVGVAISYIETIFGFKPYIENIIPKKDKSIYEYRFSKEITDERYLRIIPCDVYERRS